MRPQRIENLEQRLEEWNKEKRVWFCEELPMVLIIGIFACSGMMYLVSFKEPCVGLSWLLWGVIFGIGLSISLLKMTYPEKPTQADVEADIALRKAFNIDATVTNKKD